MNNAYTYVDFVTGKIRRTRGKFIGWSRPTGLLNVRYAIFQTSCTYVNVPYYCLTRETKERLAAAVLAAAEEAA